LPRIPEAVGFLTIFPFGRRAFRADQVGTILMAFPTVGLLVGACVWGCHWLLLSRVLPGTSQPVADAAAVLVWVLITGALHIDGLADSFDGLFGGASPEARLRIMRDERVGTFGLVAVVAVLWLKWACLGAIRSGNPCQHWGSSAMFVPIVFAAVLGRWAMVVAMSAGRYPPNEHGLASLFVENARPSHAVASALLVPVPLVAFLVWEDFRVALSIACFFSALVFPLLWVFFVRRRMRGITGDTIGAVCEIVEVLVLLSFACAAGWQESLSAGTRG